VVEFDVPRNKWLMFEKPRRTIVAVVKANTLVSLYRKERERIFAVNIRSFLGRKGINKDIVAMANQHPDSFFYFNNGVSAICTDIEFDEKTGRFRGENFQVINGAQTIGALKSAKDLSPDTEVYRHQPTLAALEQMVEAKEVSLILPKQSVDEFARNKERIIRDSGKSLSSTFKRVKEAVRQFGNPKGRDKSLA